MGKRKAPGGAALRGGNAAKKGRPSDRASGGGAGSAIEKLYSLADEILVLGDGDFTFAKGLVAHRSGGKNLVATSYDSESKVRAKYSNAADCIAAVRAAGAHVLHSVDATKLHTVSRRSQEAGIKIPPFFKYIIFNFPHTGQQRVHINRALLLEFFESARDKLVKAGEVHITLKNRPPYSNWLVEDQAKAAGFVLKARRKFNLRNFPGYNHRTTDPQAKAFEAELCTTYVFVVNRSKYPFDPTAAVQREKEHLGDDADDDGDDKDESDGRDDESAEEDEGEDAAVTEQDTATAPVKSTATTSKRKRAKHRTAPTVEALNRAMPNAEQKKPRAASPFKLWRPLHRR